VLVVVVVVDVDVVVDDVVDVVGGAVVVVVVVLVGGGAVVVVVGAGCGAVDGAGCDGGGLGAGAGRIDVTTTRRRRTDTSACERLGGARTAGAGVAGAGATARAVVGGDDGGLVLAVVGGAIGSFRSCSPSTRVVARVCPPWCSFQATALPPSPASASMVSTANSRCLFPTPSALEAPPPPGARARVRPGTSPVGAAAPRRTAGIARPQPPHTV
jgi:hypothetical protein